MGVEREEARFLREHQICNIGHACHELTSGRASHATSTRNDWRRLQRDHCIAGTAAHALRRVQPPARLRPPRIQWQPMTSLSRREFLGAAAAATTSAAPAQPNILF
ncbi:MAG: twin-arginine translocation signal domain-containing protein, partial [Acidobacteria bacterium]|nr:twin-arginine translocation signal domain-containing protein [Acidobacteriota bacterium]